MTLTDLGGDDGLYREMMATGATALADDGHFYGSVQTAVTNASSFVLMGPQPTAETVNISTNDFALFGMGEGSIIDGGTGSSVKVDAKRVTVANLKLVTNDADGKHGVTNGSNQYRCIVQNCTLNTGGQAIKQSGQSVIRNNVIKNAGTDGGFSPAIVAGKVIVGNRIHKSTHDGIYHPGDNSIIANNTVFNARHGINLDGNDNIAIGNRVHNAGGDGIRVAGSGAADNIVANNRISGSGQSDIDNGATTTTLDANVTGARN